MGSSGLRVQSGKSSANTEAAVSPSVRLRCQAAAEQLLLLSHLSQFQHKQNPVQGFFFPSPQHVHLQPCAQKRHARRRIIIKCHQRSGTKGKPGERTKATDMQDCARRPSANVTFSHGHGEISGGGKRRGEWRRFASEAAPPLD